MKKRILALALAATTAFSMFGASLSVSAAGIDKWVTDSNYQKPAELAVEYTAATDNEAASAYFTYGGTEIDISDIVFAANYSDAMEYEVSKDVPYIYDYVNDNSVTWAKVEDAYNDGDVIALGKLLKGSDLVAGKNAIAPVTKDNGVSTFRHDLESKFAAFVKGMINPNLIQDDADYNFKGLIADIKGLTVSALTSSQVIAYMQAYELYMEYSTLPDLNAQIDAVQATIDALFGRTADDFSTATQYKYFVADLEAAQEALDTATTYAKVAEVSAKVSEIATKYTSAGANKTELKNALMALFDGVSITTIRMYEEYPSNGANKAIYDSGDYDVKGDAWKTFAAAYKNAVAMYKTVNSKSYQTDVDNMVAKLEAAVDGLSSNTTVPNYIIVKLEEYIAKVAELESSDYTKATWKALEAALVKAEAILDMAKPGISAATNAADALEDAYEALKLQTPTASEKKALVSAVTAAEKALKALDKASNGAQYYALTAAINDAKALYDTYSSDMKETTSKSAIAAAIDALNAAIDFSDVVLGWNKLADGSYMYGAEDGYVTSAWKWIGSSWYYFDAKGIMVTGWQQLDGAWYYFYTWGGMAKGWAQVNGTWYYLNPNGGKMLSNGWNWIDGKCYYFYSWGGMAANTTIDGYKVDASGAWVK